MCAHTHTLPPSLLVRAAYGPVAEMKLHKKGGYGFIKYELHESAVEAIVRNHGKELHGKVLKCSWGKNIVSSTANAASSGLGLANALQVCTIWHVLA